MIKENSKLTEEVFKELSQKILGSPKLQDKFINDIFANFTPLPTTHNIHTIEEENLDQLNNINPKIDHNPKDQIMTKPEMTVAVILKQQKTLNIHMRTMVYNSIKAKSKQIQKSPHNFSHKEVQANARNLLCKYFCHYCKILQQIQLQPEARRLEKDIIKLFISNTVDITVTLFNKGFRKMITLLKCVVKLMFVGNFFSQLTLSKIKKQIILLIGVRVDELLPHHNRLAYENAYILKGANVPTNLDTMIDEFQKQKILKSKQKRQTLKKVKKQLKQFISNSTSEKKTFHQNPTKKVKIQQHSTSKSNISNFLTVKHHHIIEQLPVQIDTNLKFSLKSESLKSNPLESENFQHVTTSNFKQQQRYTPQSQDLTYHSTQKIQNSKLEHNINVKLQKSTKLQQKPKVSNSHKKTSYKVVETILLDESDDFCKIETIPTITAQYKTNLQKRQHKIEQSITAEAKKNLQKRLQKIEQSITSLSTDNEGPTYNQVRQPSNLNNLSKRLSSEFIEGIKKMFKDSKTKKDHDKNSGV